MNRRGMLGAGFALLGAFVGGVVGARFVHGDFGLLAFVVGGAVVGWMAGVTAAIRQDRSDS